MIRTTCALAAALAAALALAASSHAQIRRERGTAMSMEELQREPITFQLDVPYADTDHPRQRLDLYLPKHPNHDILPVIVFLHGGAWAKGDKAHGAGRLMPFVRTGDFAGVSVGYRLSDEATWPAPLHDCKAAVRWVRAHAAQYKLDPERIGVWGRSAGGHLALMVGLTSDVAELEGRLGPHADTSSRVACVANFFGVTDLVALVDEPSDIDRTRPDAPEARLLGGPLLENRELAQWASPVSHISPDDPPVLTIHGNHDRTVPYQQAVLLDTALRQAGVPSFLVTIDGGGHGDFGQAANARLAAFFGKYLRGQEVEVRTESIEKP